MPSDHAPAPGRAEYARSRYAHLKAVGLCARCAQVQPPTGMALCRRCQPGGKQSVALEDQPLSPIAVQLWLSSAMINGINGTGRRALDAAPLVEGTVMFLDSLLAELESWDKTRARQWRRDVIRALEEPQDAP